MRRVVIILLSLLFIACESYNLRFQSNALHQSFYESSDERDTLTISAASKTGSFDNSGGNSTSQAGGHGSIFGNVTSISDLKGSLSILLIVAIVLILEHFFRAIQESTIGTPFEDMVVAIKNEMMIVGCMAFMFRIIVGAGSPDMIEHDWYFALEYADTLIPITSFCFCFEGLVLVYLSMKQLGIWTRSYRLKLVEIFYEYFTKSSSRRLSYQFYYLPISTVHAVMEFRIMNCIFCEEYYVLPNAFPFHQYAVKVMEKSMTEMVELQPLDWFVVVVLVFLNWARNSLHGDMVHCSSAGDDHSSHSDAYLQCKANNAMQLFAVFGAVMFILTLLLAVLSRLYELRVLASHGVVSANDYVAFLTNYEVNGSIGSKKSAKLDEETFRSKIEDIKVRHALAEEQKVLNGLMGHNEKMKSHPTPYQSLNDICMDAIAGCISSVVHLVSRCFHSCARDRQILVVPTNAAAYESGYLDNRGNSSWKSSSQTLTGTSPVKASATSLLSRDAIYRSYTKATPPTSAALEEGLEATNASKNRARARTASHEQQVSVKGRRRMSVSPAFRLDQMKKLHNSPVAATGRLERGYSDKLANLFLFNSPLLYFASIRISIMIISFYNSLWLTNFLQSSTTQLHSTYWGIVSLLPGVLSFVAYMYIARSAALLKAMVYLDFECIEETLDDVETSRKIAEEMRQKLRLKLPDKDLPVVQQLQEIFDNIDAMSRLKFKTFLESISIVFSRTKWSQIFTEIDRNFDDAVSLQELLMFLYPDDLVIQQVEHEYLMNVERTLKGFMNIELLRNATAGQIEEGEEEEGQEEELNREHGQERDQLSRFNYSKALSAVREESTSTRASSCSSQQQQQQQLQLDNNNIIKAAGNDNGNINTSIAAVRLPPIEIENSH